MLTTTAGQLLINSALPPALRDYTATLDKKGALKLLQRLAEEYPEHYRQAAHQLMQLSRRFAYESGGNSFGVSHLRPGRSTIAARRRIQEGIARALQSGQTPDERRDRINAAVDAEREPLTKALYDESLAEQNPLALQVLSGSRGNPTNLRSLRGFDGAYEDHHGNRIDIPILRNYAEGLSPAEYWASTYGARKGVIDVKSATADAGYISKQLNQAAHRLLVSDIDDPDDPDNQNRRGIPVAADDHDYVGAMLAVDHGPYKRNTALTAKIMADLRRHDFNELLVRSPIAGGPSDGGVYARDVGVRERGRLAPRGDFVGIAAAQALAEKLTQAQLCLAAGTPVRMADGSSRSIETLRVGDMVLGADSTGMTFPVRVLRVFDNGLRDCEIYSFRRPFSKEIVARVTATPDHKALCIRHCSGQKDESLNHIPRLMPLGTKARRLSAVRPRGFTCDASFVAHPYALLLGIWLGDGIRVLPSTGVMVSCFDDSLAADVAEHIAPLGLNFTRMAGHPGQYYVAQQCDTAAHDAAGHFVPGYRNPLKQLLSQWGLLEKYAHEKTLPACVFSWDNATVSALLAGLWVTDGSVFVGNNKRGDKKPYLSYGSTSYAMLKQIQQLLATRFGIYAVGPYAHVGERKRAMYKIDITTERGIRRFAEVVPLYGKKRETLARLLHDWAPQRARQSEYGVIRTAATPVGALPTWDIEVDHPDHLFVLENGLIVSNSSKHSGGVAGAGPSGFALIDQLVQVPGTFRGGAAHAQRDGIVSDVREAPQGGRYVKIDGVDHYVGPDVPLKVKPGDEVEAGDVLSEGVPNPAELVKHKGIGEGRRYFANIFYDAYRGGGMGANRRNVELLTRGLINHVRLTEPWNDYAPDDVLPYHTIERNWEPRPGAQLMKPNQSVGRYLERPVLHYTVGTKIRKSMLPGLQRWGVANLHTHAEPPPFTAEMQRAATSISTDPDWMTRMIGSGQQKNLLTAVHRGDVSDTEGTSYVPSLAGGETFGKTGPTKGWTIDPTK